MVGLSTSQKMLLAGIIGILFTLAIAFSREDAGASFAESNPLAQIDTPTNTPVPSTPTQTPIPPTATYTPPPPTATNTPSPTPANHSPSISTISNRNTYEDVPTGFIPFTISDAETPADQLSVSAVSSNPVLVPSDNIKFGGGGSNRSIKLRPASNKTGKTTITVSVSDGLANAKSSFNLVVKPVNDAPTIDLNGGDHGTDALVTFVPSEGAIKFAQPNLRVIDVDSSKLISATIAITNPIDMLSEILAADTAGTQIEAQFSSGTLTLSGLDTKANYQDVIRSITYNNTAEPPSPDDRLIHVRLSDGYLESNLAVSTISIIDPRLVINLLPETQTIAQGGSAIFTVEVLNAGNMSLHDVLVYDELVPDCERSFGTINVGESRKYSCSISNIDLEFTNSVNTVGRDNLGHEARAENSARVEVANPNIQVVKSPASQTRLKGEPALFDVFVINTSTAVDLVNVAVFDPLVPDCSRTGIHQFNNLNAGQDIIYQCQLDDVKAAFTNVITATGTNLLTGQSVTDSSVAKVKLLDLSTSLLASPSVIRAPGGPVDFSLTITNTGSVGFSLSSLSSEDHGQLLNPDNPHLISNGCSTQSLPNMGAGEQFTCTFSGIVEGSPPFKDVTVFIEVQDNDHNLIVYRATARINMTAPVIYTNYLPLAVQQYIQPDEQNDLPCDAYPIRKNHTYYFMPDDLDDWYYFDIDTPGDVKVNLNNFLPKDGQLAIWQGSSCDNLDTLVGHNANFLPHKEVSFSAYPGRYYVWVTNSDTIGYDQPYTLFVGAP